MNIVRYGIIGLGNMGTGHMGYFQKGEVPGAKVTAICDIRQDRIDRMVGKYPDSGFKTYLSYKDLVDGGEVDAVIVAVPHYFHPEIVIYALKKGLNVICEKPAGVYTKQVKEMMEVAKTAKGLFTMMFNQRTNCLYRKMREIILSGGIGEVTRINWIITDWYRTQFYYDSGDWRGTWSGEGGGVLFNQCPHQLDLISWVTGMMPTAVRSFCNFGRFHDIEVEDDVTAYLEYANGANGVFITTTGEFPGTNRFEVAGTKGKLVCENDKLMMTKVTPDTREFTKTAKSAFVLPEKETFEVETDGVNLQHMGICRNFTNAILGKEPLFVDGKEGINGVELMDAMLLSTWLDKKVAIPIDDELYYNELKKRIAVSRRKENVIDTVADTEDTYGSKVKR